MSRLDRFEEVKQRIMGRWGERIKFPALKGKVSYEEILHSLIDEIVHCEVGTFDEYVHRLWCAIPSSWQERDGKFQDDLGEAIEQVEIVTPIMNCGIPINDDVVAGTKEIKDEIDFRKVFRACMDLLDRRGLLLEADRTEIMTEETFDEGEEK
jgi:hypothetical protein